MLLRYFKYTLLLFTLIFASVSFAAPSDTDITSAVKAKLAADNSLSGTNIIVTTTDGVVILAGNLDSHTQANTATEIAESVSGVTDVDTSKLTIKGSEQPLTDALITSKVKGKFIQQKLFGDKDVPVMSISVETNDGIVTLSGTADTQDQATNAIVIAKSVSGVKDVKSSIKVTPATT